MVFNFGIGVGGLVLGLFVLMFEFWIF